MPSAQRSFTTTTTPPGNPARAVTRSACAPTTTIRAATSARSKRLAATEANVPPASGTSAFGPPMRRPAPAASTIAATRTPPLKHVDGLAKRPL